MKPAWKQLPLINKLFAVFLIIIGIIVPVTGLTALIFPLITAPNISELKPPNNQNNHIINLTDEFERFTPGHNLIIETEVLPDAYLGLSYSTTIVGYKLILQVTDSLHADMNINLDFSNLPNGISVQNCTTQRTEHVTSGDINAPYLQDTIICDLAGYPEAVGDYPITVHLSWNQEKISEVLNLKVNP